MAQTYDMHPSDTAELDDIRARLKRLREATGLAAEAFALRQGMARGFFSELERGKRVQSKVSTLQAWAAAFDHRLEVEVEGMWRWSWSDPELQMLYAMSRPFGASAAARMWLVAALAAVRERNGVTQDDLADRLGVSGKGVQQWELGSSDPVVGRAMMQGRVLGFPVRLSLWPRQSWVFDR